MDDQILIDLVKGSISDEKYEVGIISDGALYKRDPQTNRMTFGIYGRDARLIKVETDQPEAESSSRKSKILVFYFVEELFENGFLEKESFCKKIKQEIEEVVRTFKFKNHLSKHECPPQHIYAITTEGRIEDCGGTH